MKLTKKAALAANDDIQAKIGFKPELDTKLKTDELYEQLHQKIVDVEIDDDDREDLEDSTCDVIDALAEMFTAKTEEAEVEDAVVVEEDEKPKKEKKSKEGKKVKEAEVEEIPEEKPAPKKSKKVKEEVKEAPASVKAKGKNKKAKGKVDPADLAEEIKTNKKINREGLYEIVNENPDLFGDNAETLLTITNPMVLKKQMRNVLEGGKVEMTKTKPPTRKEKAPKVAESTLTEKVSAFEDLDELKAFAKENKDSFPGVKAKKFDKIKKLRKALLEVVVEPKVKKRKSNASGKNLEEVRAERQLRIDWITDYLNKQGGKVGRKKLTAKALEAFPSPAKSVRDLISYAKNPKYNKFEKLMTEDDGVIGWVDAFEDEAPKAKKSKKAKEVAAPVKEEKKEKKGKKDKKGKKNKRK